MIRAEFNPNRVALRIKYFVRSLIFSMRRNRRGRDGALRRPAPRAAAQLFA